MARGSWETVVDPEEKAWREMAARQRARNEAQAAEADRKHRARQIEGAAGYADDAVTAAEAGTATNAYLSGSAGAKRLAETVGRVAGPVGLGLSAIEAGAGYKADRANGMPTDEALLRHGGRWVLGGIGGALGIPVGSAAGGVALGPEFAPVGAVVGGYYGSKGGKKLADGLADAAMDAKHRIWRAAAPLTDPAYVMRLLRSY